jgi:RNA polymerase sigma factor (sigma-70 family)
MEQTAYWALTQKHLPALRERARVVYYYTLLNTRMGEVYSAEDLLHETLVKTGTACEGITDDDTVEDGKSFLSYLYASMRNICYTILSKRENTDMVVNTEAASYTANDQLSPLEMLEQQDLQHNMMDAIGRMAHRHPDRAAVLLYSLDVQHYCEPGDNHKAKAAELGITETNYKQLKARGIKQLRSILNPQPS